MFFTVINLVLQSYNFTYFLREGETFKVKSKHNIE